MSDAELRAFYTDLRNKHLEQLMAINGRATFAVLALTVSLLTGLASIPSMRGSPWYGEAIVCLILATIFLTVAAVLMSLFHTGHITRLQGKAAASVLEPIDEKDLQIIPPWPGTLRLHQYPFAYVLSGVLFLLAFVLIFVISRLALAN